MGTVSSKLATLGLTLPGPIKLPPGVVLPFRFVNVRGEHAFISGHGPVHADGTLARPFGKLGRELTVEQGYKAARLTALSILGNLERELGDLDRIRAVRSAGRDRSRGRDRSVALRSGRQDWSGSVVGVADRWL
jgi:hypothetical protein